MARQGKSLIRVTLERWGPIATGGFPPEVAARLDSADQQRADEEKAESE